MVKPESGAVAQAVTGSNGTALDSEGHVAFGNGSDATGGALSLWGDSFAPNLLTVDGPDRPLNLVATCSADQRTVFLEQPDNIKVVPPPPG
jgi:hypothetical protein